MIAPEIVPTRQAMESAAWGVKETGTSKKKRTGVARMLGRYPVAMLAVGFLAGIAAGWLVKRR